MVYFLSLKMFHWQDSFHQHMQSHPLLPLTDDEIRLGKIRDYLYSNAPEDISYSTVIDEIQAIQRKFEDKPILSRYM